jgi:hypothetical protein
MKRNNSNHYGTVSDYVRRNDPNYRAYSHT